MRVLVACEFSGVVRRAFEKLGHDVLSCDLLPSDDNSPYHYVGDVRDLLEQKWDLMIAHPPCTDLAVSGAAWFKEKIADGRQQRALDFVRMLMDADIPRICIENPVSVISSKIRKPDQIIQPWWFGEDASKKTCLWLKNLPLLVETNRLLGDNTTRRANQTASGQNKIGPSPYRWKERSKTYQGIADGMADQWGRMQ